jgi:hypothetical protein
VTLRRDFTLTEQELARFVARELEKSVLKNCDLRLELHDADFMQPRLREFMWLYTVDAMN